METKIETLPVEIEQTSRWVFQPHRSLNALKHVLLRFFAVSLTILIGIFATVVIANHGGMLDKAINSRINREVMMRSLDSNFQEDQSKLRQELEAAEGLSQPFWPKHFLYTLRALRLDWGDVLDRMKFSGYVMEGLSPVFTMDSRQIILSRLPNTLLLSGVSFLLLALIGIPTAIFLSHREGHWIDRLTGMLTPLSSIPSWVIGILLVMVFAVQLKILPVGKMYESIPPATAWETIVVLLRHMILPVSAVVLSLIFQLVYSWRTYLLIYADEDYLILAKAKGLQKYVIDFHYVLRPAFPYIVTNLAITLVGFWQMTTVLEFFFQWPGIGKLFMDALPHFHKETMYSGEMSIVLGIVVLFAYLLGATVFLLDFSYIIFDPRIRVGSQEQSFIEAQSRPRRGWRASFQRMFRRSTRHSLPRSGSAVRRPVSIRRGILDAASTAAGAFKTVFQEVFRVPSAVIGLVLVSLLLLASILIIVGIPYDPLVKSWNRSAFSSAPSSAKMALPKWVNWFRKEDLPPTIVLKASHGAEQSQLNFAFDYPYRDFPPEMALYLTNDCQEKMPFISLDWTTPDGRLIALKSSSVSNTFTYAFTGNVPVKREVRLNGNLKQWVITAGAHKTPEHYLLFAKPQSARPEVLEGAYGLTINGTFFEQDCSLDGRLVIYGMVEGWAGTDYLRRDLSIPLLWGLPYALMIGIIGAVTTSLISLVLAAASAWIGGWVDSIIQRATEVNLILPVMAISVLLYAYYNVDFWFIMGLIILSTVLGSSIKGYRAAFLQEKSAGYIEAARAYGASDGRIISHYLVRRIVPVMIPQMIMLIPTFIFLESTLAIFNIIDARFPTWGGMLFSALRYGALYGSRFWVLQPITLMLITGLAFVLLNFALHRILTPRLKEK